MNGGKRFVGDFFRATSVEVKMLGGERSQSNVRLFFEFDHFSSFFGLRQSGVEMPGECLREFRNLEPSYLPSTTLESCYAFVFPFSVYHSAYLIQTKSTQRKIPSKPKTR
jgi:hypothetical protein